MFATITTVNNNPNSPGQYTNLQTAINDATPGDTLLVSGSNTSYGSITLNKTLTLIGQGFDTNYTFDEPTTVLNSLSLDYFDAVQSASGSRISGFYINSVNFQAYQHVNDIIIERNSINSMSLTHSFNVTNVIIQNNIFRATSTNIAIASSSAVPYARTMTIRNNFFTGVLTGYITSPTNFVDLAGVSIKNNFFSNSGTGTVLYQLKNAVLEDNIFFRKDPGINSDDNNSADCNSCVFNNNIIYSTQYDGTYDPNILYGNNVGSGNIIATDPLLVNFPLTGAAWAFGYDYNFDVGSVGINAGTDGTDIGVYGGARPMPDLILPRIPQMTSLTATPSSVPVGGTLQIQFSGQKQD